MTRKTIVIFLFAMVGCKGETITKDNPDTIRDLDSCKKTLEEKNKLVQALQDENASLMRQGSGSEIVVAIEGNALTVRPGKPGEVRPIDDKTAAAASKEFLNVVEKSRGAIQKCYEQALKKNTGLQAKTITLTVSASFSAQGAYQNSSFSPSLGDTFDNCIKTVATKWVLPTNSPAMTFKAQVSLTPS
ncbi:MAG TPA: hypothetical protein VLB44_04430 [Kofleriaceae bacterium]|nr:hypothetical protein [Kofleriaceae bacterium]